MLKPNKKLIDTLRIGLRPTTRLFVFEGTIRSSKTVIAKQLFFYKVYDSDAPLHLIAGKDLDTIKNNILEDELGLLTLYPEYCSLEKDRVGRSYVRMETPKGVKKILLAGYADKSKWTNIVGLSIENIFVDEVNVANKQFIDECFARQVSFDTPLTIWTLNGDSPTHYIYTDYINRCETVGDVPASIRADMDRTPKTKGWLYEHFTMADNPIMTPEKIAAAEKIYPKGSYYYTIKILGERGTPNDNIFIEYMSDDLFEDVDTLEYSEWGVGVDIGATRAKNSVCLIGWKPDYSKACICDLVEFQQCGYAAKTEKLIAAIQRWGQIVPISYVAVDSAEQNYIEDLKTRFKKEHLPPVIGSYKATIKERIDMLIIGFATGRIVFNKNEGGRKAYNAYRMAKWADGQKGQKREDLNEPQNDIMDSAEYGLTRHMRAFLRSNNGN